ncbi:aspartate-semialdehyde dehydrogenase [Acidihalobacter yilgarnensis]|nr:aspartate-semialdehyde dehydrogenase [Acidihalobacter yilgarnensis]
MVGATGMVGEAVLAILAERNFPARKVHALASARSFGEDMSYGKRSLAVEDLATFDFAGVDLAIFAVPAEVAALHVPRAVSAGCVVIDHSDCYVDDVDVPLVVPEINASALSDYKQRGIIASPCGSAALMPVLKPLHDLVGITRVRLTTCQAVSGGGRLGVEALARQTAALLNAQPAEAGTDNVQTAFNVRPMVGGADADGYTRNESRMMREIRRLLADEGIGVDVALVDVPVFFGHSSVVRLETREALGVEAACDLLRAAPGVLLVELPEQPTAVSHASGRDEVLVGRIRRDQSHPHGLQLWVVADNLRKGAALNSVQIAEILIKDYI